MAENPSFGAIRLGWMLILLPSASLDFPWAEHALTSEIDPEAEVPPVLANGCFRGTSRSQKLKPLCLLMTTHTGHSKSRATRIPYRQSEFARRRWHGYRSMVAELGLGQYASAFADNDIDYAVLVQLTDADLKELGISSLGHRKRLLAAIAEKGLAAPVGTVHSSTVSESERRQVTILFADLCGFTALSQSLDPEEVRELVGRFTALVDGIVVGYGGTVDKHIGDAVMALFGAPRAHDDDPMRAASAALDIHEALAQLSETASRPLQAHVGIANGEVVAGTVGRADVHDYTVLGDSVNLAARLVAAAGPRQTLISDGVYRALSGRGA
jgi:class 3 adenylate cyclase